MTKAIFSAFAGFALVIGLAASANAQGVCQFGGSAGIKAGVINADLEPGTGPFFFTGTLGPCGGAGGKVCSVGTVSNAACPANEHGGTFQVWSGNCQVECRPVANPWDPQDPNKWGPCPDNGNWQQTRIRPGSGQGTKLAEGSFDGICAGSNCSGGGTDGLAYSLFFDVPTVQNALNQCDPDGVGSITKATFTGAGAYQ